DRLGVVACNHTAQCRGNEQIDLQRQELLVGDAVGLGVSLEQAVVAEGELEHAGNIETAGAKIGSGLIADGDDLVLRLVQKLGGVRADIPEPLQGDARLRRLAAEVRQELEGENADAAARRPCAPLEAATPRRT